MSAILIANRGEVAIRIARAARKLGLEPVGIYSTDDATSLHVAHMARAVALPGSGAAAYLDQEAILSAAEQAGCNLLHPGYGFLSENAAFARLCVERGVRFVGPTPDVLELFGDKIRARTLAAELGVPVMPGTTHPTGLEEARAFASEHGAVMLKAMAGGGGRGMRAVHHPAGLDAVYESCRSEALQAFGVGDLYVEKLVPAARHIEVQVIGDGSGAVTHLWERDCSVQRRHQKLVEIAPAPDLAPGLRASLLDAATALAAHVDYDSLGTLEFLVRADGFWFMEANPRLQVEHTITEEITGVDLVQAQIRIALGATLADVGLVESPPVRGFAIQARVNLETLREDGAPVPRAGKLAAYAPPRGPDVRVDDYGYAGYATSLRYDSLLAKVIARGKSFDAAAETCREALREFVIDGVPTNIPLLMSILAHPAFLSGRFDTSLIAAHLPDLLARAEVQLPMVSPGATAATESAAAAVGRLVAQAGEQVVASPMSGTVVSILAKAGDALRLGDPLLVLEAMKMEHVIRAAVAGKLVALAPDVGDPVAEGEGVALIAAGENAGEAAPAPAVRAIASDGDWSAEVAEIARRKELALALGGPDKVARQKAQGKLTVRERIDALADPGSFIELGALTGFASYDDDGDLQTLLPANFVAGTARVDGRKVVIGADDFTVRAGSGDAAIHEKQIFAENYAREMRLPMLRLLDGASGGGSVKIAQETGFHYLPVNPGWDAVVDSLSLVPVVAACLGPTVGLGAARLVMSHLAVMVVGLGQVFTAGPPIVEGATREKLGKEELGGFEIHRRNGIVERFVASEAEAFDVIRRFLSYLPQSVFQLPPVIEATDPVLTERSDRLIAAIPRNPRQPYDIASIMDAIFDRGSILPYAEYGGSIVTALARLDGHPVGVVTTDPHKGATINAEGAMAVTRFVDLCETFHLPLVSLTDQAGMSIGSEAERRGTIRYGARAISAVYQARIPQAEIVLRRVFGVGGAGAVNRHRASRSWSWPSGTWGSLPQQGGIEAAFRAELERAADREAEIARIATQLERIGSPFRTAERFGVQDVIDPRESRALLCDWVRDAYALLPEQIGRPSFGLRP